MHSFWLLSNHPIEISKKWHNLSANFQQPRISLEKLGKNNFSSNKIVINKFFSGTMLFVRIHSEAAIC